MAKKAETKKAVKKYALNDEGRSNYDMSAILDNEEESSKLMRDDNYERVSYPPMIKPNDIPEGQTIRGVLLSVRPSSKFEKQQILLLRATKTGQEISVPAVRGISVYLFDKGTNQLNEDLIGKELVIRRKGTKYSEKNKKEYPIFDVAIGKKVVVKS